jgi:WD40 repeat protein/CHAT domain-containing protein
MSITYRLTIKPDGAGFKVELKNPKSIFIENYPLNWQLTSQDQQTVDQLSNSEYVSPTKTEALGKSLYNILIPPALDKKLLVERGRVKPNQGLRLSLSVETPELSTIPWELIHNGEEYLSASGQTTLVRRVPQNIPTVHNLAVRGPLKILVASASPSDMPKPVDLEAFVEDLCSRLQKGQEKKGKAIQLDVLESATPESLKSKLVKNYHILFFIGHGDNQHIYLEDHTGYDISQVEQLPPGEPCPITGSELASELVGRSTRLVFLAACETGQPMKTEASLAGFSYELAQRAGLPAVVAMQYKVNQNRASQIAAWFFEALAQGQEVDKALAEARRGLLFDDYNGKELAAPVLILQTTNASLFPAYRNWPAISAVIIAMLFVIALIIQQIFFAPDRTQIQQAYQTATVAISGRVTAEANTAKEQQKAQSQSGIAIARKLASQSAKAKDQQQAILLAVESLRRAITTEGYQAVINSLSSSSRIVAEVPMKPDENTFRGLLPDGTTHTSVDFPALIDMLHYDPDQNLIIKPIIDGQQDNKKVRITVNRIHPGDWQMVQSVSRLVDWDALIGNMSDRMYQNARFSTNGRYCLYSDGADLIVWDVTTDQDLLRVPMPGIVVTRFSQNDSSVMAITSDGYVSQWAIPSGEQVSSFHVEEPVRDAEIMPDSSALVVGTGKEESKDSVLLIYSWGKEQPLLRLQGALLAGVSQDSKFVVVFPYTDDKHLYHFERTDVVFYQVGKNSPSFSVKNEAFYGFRPDTDQAVLMTNNGNLLRLVDIANGKQTAQFAHPETCGGFHGLSFSPDGSMLATSCSSGNLYIWGTTSAEILTTIQLSYVPDTLVFSHNDRSLAAANLDTLPVDSVHSNQVTLWNVPQGTPAGQVIAGKLVEAQGVVMDITSSLLYDPGSKWLITTDSKNTLRVLSLSSSWTDKVAEYVYSQGGLPGSIADSWSYALSTFSPVEPLVAISGGDGNTLIWDFKKNQVLYEMSKMNAEATQEMGFSPDGKWLFTTGDFCQTPDSCPVINVRLINPHTGEITRVGQRKVDPVTYKGISTAHPLFSPDSQLLALGWEDGALEVYKAGNWKQISKILLDGTIQNLSFSKDHKLLAVGLKEGIVYVLQTESGLKKVAQWKVPQLTTLAMRYDGKFVVTGSESTITLWDSKTGESQGEQQIGTKASFVAFNEDGSHVLTAGANLLTIWTPNEGNTLVNAQLPQRYGQFTSSEDGRWVFTGMNGQYLVLETNSGKEVMHFPSGPLSALSPDQHFYTTNTDQKGTIGVWRWQPTDLIDAACQQAGRNFTQQEWSSYFSDEAYRETCPK